MKVQVKPLKGSPFNIDVEEKQTIKEVKEIIQTSQNWPVSSQKLIHAGKIMADDKPLSEYKVKDGGFIVCMVSKKAATATSEPKAAPSTTDSNTTPTPASNSNTSASSNTTATPPPSTNTTTTTTTTATTNETTSNPNPPAVTLNAGDAFSGPEFEKGVEQLKDMGFPEDDCRAALRAAFGNSPRAVEFLMNGIPDEAAAAAVPGATANMTQEQAATANTATITPNSNSNGLDALRQLPQFNNLRRVVQNNPTALSQVLQQIEQTNPELLQAINDNREEFVRIMNEPIVESSGSTPPSVAQQGNDPNAAAAAAFGGAGGANPQQFAAVLQAMQQMPPEQRAQLAQAMGVPPEQLQAITQMMQNMPPQAMAQMMEAMMQGGPAGGPAGPGSGGQQNVVHLTREEAASIDRLMELGFPKHSCVEAFLACDKDEQLAANYLFTNPPEPMEEDTPNPPPS